ncbi:alpha-1D adrenergic receptor isoform X1 [Oryctolagus cuniculus]|uniref:alpha-1D adrenergic receptor isoform X1 n=1 Tax=Oryctolagus cuniculus TaxID=9986 RepID=UPI0038798C19
MTFRDLLSVTFEGPRPDISAGGSGAGGGAGAGDTASSESPAVGGVPGAAGGGGGGSVVGAGSGEDNRSSAGEPGGAGGGGEVNSTAAVGGLVVSAQSVGVGVFLAAFILTAVAGNLLVILSVACNRHLQTVTNYFIVNLAVADLLLSATVLPFSATMEVLGFWAFGRAFCDVWAAVDVLCCTASILSLCTISVDRYVGVRHSLKYPAIMTERKAAAILALLWAVALVVSMGPLLGWKEPVPPDERFCGITEEVGYAVFSSLCSFYLPMAVIVVMYCRVYVVARSTTRSLEAGVKRERGKASEVVLRIHCRGAASGADGAPGTRGAKGHTFRSSLSVRLLKFSREKKAAKTLAIVVGVFVLCWFPFFFVLPLESASGRAQGKANLGRIQEGNRGPRELRLNPSSFLCTELPAHRRLLPKPPEHKQNMNATARPQPRCSPILINAGWYHCPLASFRLTPGKHSPRICHPGLNIKGSEPESQGYFQHSVLLCTVEGCCSGGPPSWRLKSINPAGPHIPESTLGPRTRRLSATVSGHCPGPSPGPRAPLSGRMQKWGGAGREQTQVFSGSLLSAGLWKGKRGR